MGGMNRREVLRAIGATGLCLVVPFGWVGEKIQVGVATFREGLDFDSLYIYPGDTVTLESFTIAVPAE